MRSKSIMIVVVACILFAIVGCGLEKENNKQSAPKTKIINTTSLEKYDIKDITSFTTENADILLNDSKSLPHSENTTFTPLALNNKGEVFGESMKADNTVALLMLNVHTGEYTELFIAEEGTTIGVSGANDDYVLFSVVNQGKGTVVYYCMNIVDHKNNTIYKSEYFNGVAVPSVEFIDNIAYISLPTQTKDGKNIDYPIIRYDMEKNEQESIEEKRADFPVYFENNLYYIRIDNEKKTTEIVQYDLKTKKKTTIAKGNEKNGYFYNLTTDGTSLVVQLYYANNYINFYKIDVYSKKITPYFVIRGVFSFKGDDGYYTWSAQQENDTQVRKPISFIDEKKQIVYKYDGSLIYFSEKGILWVKYAIDEREIPRAKIFTKDNSVLMWHPFS